MQDSIASGPSGGHRALVGWRCIDAFGGRRWNPWLQRMVCLSFWIGFFSMNNWRSAEVNVRKFSSLNDEGIIKTKEDFRWRRQLGTDQGGKEDGCRFKYKSDHQWVTTRCFFFCREQEFYGVQASPMISLYDSSFPVRVLSFLARNRQTR